MNHATATLTLANGHEVDVQTYAGWRVRLTFTDGGNVVELSECDAAQLASIKLGSTARITDNCELSTWSSTGTRAMLHVGANGIGWTIAIDQADIERLRLAVRDALEACGHDLADLDGGHDD